MAHIIGIMGMIFGFISMAIQNYAGAYSCFGYAFILWVLIAIDDYKHTRTPTADVVEVKQGEWLPVQYTYFGLKRYECSECKDDEYWQKRYLEHKEKHCPNCGAKMRGDTE